ncbi:unnamed protein product [Rangifer tarandus platyrhynchus]|uniref:Uncharacterized protein n=1 Tax=Rangifer tarandus platyrhynchus TaxID=3082113 RepID=A0AC59Z6D3_RANTA
MQELALRLSLLSSRVLSLGSKLEKDGTECAPAQQLLNSDSSSTRASALGKIRAVSQGDKERSKADGPQGKEVDGDGGMGHSGRGSTDDRLQKRAWLPLTFCRTACKSRCAALGVGTADEVTPPVLSGRAPSPFPGPRRPRKQRAVSTSLPPPAEGQQERGSCQGPGTAEVPVERRAPRPDWNSTQDMGTRGDSPDKGMFLPPLSKLVLAEDTCGQVDHPPPCWS